MKYQVLYVASLSLLIALLFVTSHFHIYRRNPAFMLWLLFSLGMNVALQCFAWAGAKQWFWQASFSYQVLSWPMAALVLLNCVLLWQDPTSRIIAKGVGALCLITIVSRYAAEAGVVSNSPRMVLAVNLAYIAPAAYMVWALSRVQYQMIPLSRFLPSIRLARLASEAMARVINS